MSPTLAPPASRLDATAFAVAAAWHGRDLGSASTQPATQDPHGIDR